MNRTIKTTLLCLAVVTALVGLDRLIRADVPTVSSNEWEQTSDMSHARAGAASTLMYDGRVLVTGGTSADGVTASVERYSPEGGAFLSTPPMAIARANHSSSLLADGRVLVAGGVDADGAALSSAEIYDPATNSWATIAPLNYAR